VERLITNSGGQAFFFQEFAGGCPKIVYIPQALYDREALEPVIDFCIREAIPKLQFLD
jgi:hypothetical protein